MLADELDKVMKSFEGRQMSPMMEYEIKTAVDEMLEKNGWHYYDVIFEDCCLDLIPLINFKYIGNGHPQFVKGEVYTPDDILHVFENIDPNEFEEQE